MIMVESTVLKNIDARKQESKCRCFKAKLLTNNKAGQTDDTLQSAIDNDQTIVLADQSTSYVNIADYVEAYMSEKSNESAGK